VLLTASELLTTWERGVGSAAGERALELAALACPDLAEAERGALTAGERDRALLDLREHLFGTTVDAVLSCEGCGETLELAATIDELRTDGAGGHDGTRTLSQGGYELRLRQPTALDLAEIADGTLEEASADLLERCVLEASVGDRAVEARELPDHIVAAVDATLASADPQADLELAVECPSCGSASTTRFDIASFLWSEIERFALATLREVHVLASAYGWSEPQILALGSRRRLYLELVEG
jgi:hypothetical protein